MLNFFLHALLMLYLLLSNTIWEGLWNDFYIQTHSVECINENPVTYYYTSWNFYFDLFNEVVFFLFIPGESFKAFYILNYLSKHSIYRPWHLLKNQGFNNKKKEFIEPEQIFSRTEIMWQRSDFLKDTTYLSRHTFSIYVRDNWLICMITCKYSADCC